MKELILRYCMCKPFRTGINQIHKFYYFIFNKIVYKVNPINYVDLVHSLNLISQFAVLFVKF